jgi:hypothetical protein
MNKGSKAAAIVVLILVVLFGVGQFFSFSNVSAPTPTTTTSPSTPTPTSTQMASTTTHTPATQVIAYSAMNSPAVTTTSTPVKKGSCFASSVAAPYRADAYRCTVGNAISDPCFELSSTSDTIISAFPQNTIKVKGYLLCGANPAETDTSSPFVLQLTKALPKSETPTGTVPSNWAWLVELNDGTVCSPFTGTRPFDASGDVAVYSCNGAAAGENMIFGDLNNSSSVWTAEIGILSTSTKLFPPTMLASTTVPVYAVWQ